MIGMWCVIHKYYEWDQKYNILGQVIKETEDGFLVKIHPTDECPNITTYNKVYPTDDFRHFVLFDTETEVRTYNSHYNKVDIELRTKENRL